MSIIILPEFFIQIFINSDSNQTQTRILAIKLSPNLTSPNPNLNPNLNRYKVNEKWSNKYCSISFY